MPLPLREWFGEALSHHGVVDVAVDWRIAQLATSLPWLHRDPADRIIVATAVVTNLPVLTPDRLIAKYRQITVLW